MRVDELCVLDWQERFLTRIAAHWSHATLFSNYGTMRKFKKGDLLANKNSQQYKPLARVNMVKKGVVHCVNLIPCATMEVGQQFHFTPDIRTRYVLHGE